MKKGIDLIRNSYGMARKIAHTLGITPAAVSQWRSVPLERVPTVARITGIPPHKLRPDLPEFFPEPKNDDVCRETVKDK